MVLLLQQKTVVQNLQTKQNLKQKVQIQNLANVSPEEQHLKKTAEA